jgi:hypothetical protein
MPSAAAIVFNTPSDAGTATNASAGEAGEAAALGLVPGGGPDADGVGTADDEGAALPSLGDDEVAQADMTAAAAIRTTDRRIVGRRLMPMTED